MSDEVTRKLYISKCHWCVDAIGETDLIYRLDEDQNKIFCTKCADPYFKKQERLATVSRYMIALGVILLLWGIV